MQAEAGEPCVSEALQYCLRSEESEGHTPTASASPECFELWVINAEFILVLLFMNIVLFSMRTTVSLSLLCPEFPGPCDDESVVWGELAWEAACFTSRPGEHEPRRTAWEPSPPRMSERFWGSRSIAAWTPDPWAPMSAGLE